MMIKDGSKNQCFIKNLSKQNNEIILKERNRASFGDMYPKLAVIDMAGTCIDDDGLVQQAAMNAMKHIANVEISKKEADKVMGIPKNIAFEILCSNHNIEHDKILLLALLSYFNTELHEVYQNPQNVRLMPYTMELFTEMRRRKTFVYLNTGFERALAATIIKTVNIENLIDGYIGSDEVRNGRPYPDMILAIMEELGIYDAGRVMKIGDTVSDLLEGHSANCGWNIAVLTGAQGLEDLKLAPHTEIVNSLNDIIPYFKQ